MSAIQNQFLRLLISKNREVNKFERQIQIRNIAQLLPSKKPSTNARAPISNLQEGNYYNSNYVCYGRQKLLSSQSGQCAKPLGRPPKLIMQSLQEGKQ